MRKDYTGMKFYRLTFVRPTDKRIKTGGVIWEALCDCGNTTEVCPSNDTMSCGCLAVQALKQMNMARPGKENVSRDLTTHAWKQDHKGLDLPTFLDIYRVCSWCNELLLKTKFNTSKRAFDGYYSYCRGCAKKQLDDVVLMRMVFVLSYAKTMGCIDCGEKDPIVLEYDHVRGKKFERISLMVHEAYSAKRLLSEIAKCEIRCSSCHRIKTAEQCGWYSDNSDRPYRTKRRAFVHEYLGTHPCVDCGETDIRVLEFDHVRGEKIRSVSTMITQEWSEKKIAAEIAKCEVRCVNCHRRKSAIQLGCYKDIDVPNLPELDLTKPLETYLPKRNRWDGHKKKP